VTKKQAKRGPRLGSSAIARRADLLLSDKIADGPDEGQLTTQDVADWFRCSTQLLEKMRMDGTGPRFETLGPRMVRYRRKDCRSYLQRHLHDSTAEYSKRRAKR
jgi:hypothetical protein